MKRLNDLIGLPVVSSQDGRILGNLTGLRLKSGGAEILGMCVRTAGLRQRRLVASAQDTLMLGDMSAVVRRLSDVPPAPAWTPQPGQRVLSTDGGLLGLLSGALVDCDHMQVVALEISRGALDDFRMGRLWVRSFRGSDERIIASPEEIDDGEEGDA